jgi:hypothetical protein
MRDVPMESKALEAEPQGGPAFEMLAIETRETIGEILASEESDVELEKHIFDAIDTIDPLLKKKKLGRSDMDLMRSSLKVFGDELVAMEYLGVEGAKKYFELLSGNDPNSPYILPQALDDNDLEAYLFYDMAHDDPEYQDQCAMDYIEGTVSNISLNILVSRFKGNPDLSAKILSSAPLRGDNGVSVMAEFIGQVRGNSRYQRAYSLIYYFLANDRRVDLVIKYYKAINQRKMTVASQLRKRIVNMDRDFFKNSFFR